MSSCKNCKFRAIYDKKPTSFLGKTWRWHIGFCPGWKKYFKSLSEAEKQQLSERYKIK